jgi:hypothetical protein
MVVNGFELPAAFIQLCEAIQQGEAPVEWELKEDVDAYGQPWDPADLRFICEPERMQGFTERLSEGYLHENRFQNPGDIEDFTGVANFVEFARATDGDFYVFDFGRDLKEPSVVYWADGHWRRVAPNFDALMALFVPLGERDRSDEEELPLPGPAGWEPVQVTPRAMLAAWTLRWVVAPESRPFFEDLAQDYAGCSPEERRAVEAEVREELEQMGVTDDQWRTHEELWARLRATDRSN